LVFLIAGPATNVTTIGAIAGRFGWRIALVYLTSIIVGSMLLGWGFDQWFGVQVVETIHRHHEHDAWWQVASAVLLIVLLGFFAVQSLRRRMRRILQRDQSDSKSPLLEMQVAGMNCQGCVASIEDGLERLPQIKHVEVDLETGLLRVRGDIDRATLERAIREIGFEPVMTRT
jgi:copper chaperone CopZ